MNSFAQKKFSKTANLAGTTKRIQWIDIAKPNINFLDTQNFVAQFF
ncbi:hypothetical protein ACEW7V_02025 [Areca yellow leaf disease phytoplasma]